jgi:predicted RNA-binding protein YlxR (DUF448 family)
MVRIVRGADGRVTLDPTGKRSGRGTYVCLRTQCWTRALRTGSLGRSLKTDLAPADRAELEGYAAQLHLSADAAAEQQDSSPEPGVREGGIAHA